MEAPMNAPKAKDQENERNDCEVADRLALTREDIIQSIYYLCEQHRNEKECQPTQLASRVRHWMDGNLKIHTPDREAAVACQSLARVYLDLICTAGRMELLSDVIQMYLGALALHPQDDPDRVQIMNNLAFAYSLQHGVQPNSNSDEPNLELAIRWAQEALVLRPPGHPRRWESLLALNAYLSKSYQLDYSEEVGDIMLKNYRELRAIMPEGHPRRADALEEFADFILRMNDPEPTLLQLEEAIVSQREALAACKAGTENYRRRASNLASGLDTLYQQRPDLSTIDEAIKIYEDVLLDCPLRDPGRRDIMDNLANSYYRRAQQTHDLDSLQATLRTRREVLVISSDHPKQDFTYHDLGVALCLRYLQLGDRRDLEDSIHYFRKALHLRSRAKSRLHTETVHELAYALLLNHRLTQDPSSLDSSIRFFRMAYKDWPSSHARHLETVGWLASALMTQFKNKNDEGLLQEAIEMCVRALSISKGKNPERSASYLLYTLGEALLQKHQRTSDSGTLDEAIVALTECQRIFSENRGPALYQLISALRTRLAIRHQQEDADAIIRHTTAYQQELQSLSTDDDLQAYFHLVASETLAESEAPDNMNFLLAAGSHFLEKKSRDHPGRDLVCSVLATNLLKKDSKSFDFLRATELIQEMTYIHPSSYRLGLETLLGLLDLANHALEEHEYKPEKWRRALLAANAATVRFLPKVAYLGLEQSQLLLKARTRNMSSAAVSLALKLGEVESALELMEQGRAIFWQQSMRLRLKPSAFANVPFQMAEELQQILQQLAERVSSADEYIDSFTRPAWTRDSLTESRRLSERAETILEEIRSIAGLERFLLGPSYDDIRRLGTEGFVVVLVFHEHTCQSHGVACEALVLSPDSRDPIHVPLSNVNSQLLTTASARLVGANAQYRSALKNADPDRAMKMPGSSKRDPVGVAHGVLRELWELVVEPIFHALGLQKRNGRERPRLHWCPSGPFASVPLHAAGHGQNWCSDYVVSSYAPTLTALLEARRDAPSITQTSARLLLASAAHYDHLPRLPNVPEEAANVVAVASPGAILQLKETEGNWKYGEEVLQRLPEANILHLACHGVQDYHYPLRSAFWLGRARIEIREILQLRLDNAFLAFLSACETVTGFDTLQDEVFHMGSAMLFTGFRSVVGTMWSMGDADGPRLARQFYQALFARDVITLDDVPYALDAAVQALRRDGVPPNRWATFIHLGA